MVKISPTSAQARPPSRIACRAYVIIVEGQYFCTFARSSFSIADAKVFHDEAKARSLAAIVPGAIVQECEVHP